MNVHVVNAPPMEGIWARIAEACPAEELPGKLDGLMAVFVKIYFKLRDVRKC